MKKLICLILSTGLLFSACSSNASLQKQLKQAKMELAKTQSATNVSLIHMVYFKLKAEADQQALMKEIDKLEAIEVLHNLTVGTFEDLGDSRAMSEYGLVMQMGFKNKADYQTYQAHPIHLNLKKMVGDYLAGPPATYDFSIQ